MRDTQLILIEGPPGSGKTTTAQKLAVEISNLGQPCRCFVEWGTDNPIAIGDDLHLGEVIASSVIREDAVLQQWRAFVQERQIDHSVTVMESRFWQTSVMLMYIAGHPIEDVWVSNQRVVDVIQILKPVLIYFAIDDQSAFAARTIQLKEEEWQRGRFPGTWAQHLYEAFDSRPWFADRGLAGLPGMLAFLEEWATVAEGLYDRAPFPKVKIRNPHLDWASAIQQMRCFLDLT